MQGGIPSPLPKSLRIYLPFKIKISSKRTFLTSRLFFLLRRPAPIRNPVSQRSKRSPEASDELGKRVRTPMSWWNTSNSLGKYKYSCCFRKFNEGTSQV